MERLHPRPGPVDADEAVADPARRAAGRPWLLVNMVASVDGATAVDGTSGALGGPGDREVFGALRRVADAVLVGAATVRSERYHSPAVDDATLAGRRRAGAIGPLRVAVVTRSLDLDLGDPLFAEPANRPLVLTVDDADPARREAVEAVAEVISLGHGDVDLSAAVAAVAERAGPVLLAEGGPRLNAQLLAADLVDELNLTVGAWLVGGESRRIVEGPAPPDPVRFALRHVLRSGDDVFLRYGRV